MDDVIAIEPTVGTCMTMCPVGEMRMREREGLLHRFEVKRNIRIPRGSLPQADPQRTVKEFSRPAAGRADPKPQELRPAPVLLETAHYLVNSVIAEYGEKEYAEVYEFVADRFRAVRQDLVIQSLSGTAAIQILETIVRFHVYSAFRLCGADRNVFDPYLNEQHTRECLKRLLTLYSLSEDEMPHHTEFESLYLLQHLGDTNALSHFLELSPRLRRHPLLSQAYLISIYCMLGNTVRVLRLLKTFPSMLCVCAAHGHLQQLKCRQVRIMACAFSAKNCRYPTSHLRDLLTLDSVEEAVELCSSGGLLATDENVNFLKSDWREPEKLAEHRWGWLERRLKSIPLTDLLMGHHTATTATTTTTTTIATTTIATTTTVATSTTVAASTLSDCGRIGATASSGTEAVADIAPAAKSASCRNTAAATASTSAVP